MITATMFFRQEILQNPFFTDLVLYLYFFSLLILFTFGAHGFVMVYHYLKNRGKETILPPMSREPVVTIQLPMYNEFYVIERLIEAVCAIDYPKDKMEIQVLDDSTDESVDVAFTTVRQYRELGYDIKHIHRKDRSGFKAGALKHGLETARGEFIAIFDADFVPNTDFLRKTLPHFYQDDRVA